MNRTERKYGELLDIRQRVGEIAWYRFEGVTMKLGDDCRYTPDFAVMLANGEMEMHEVKGTASRRAANGTSVKTPFCRDDAKVKIKAAAGIFPFRFLMVYLVNNEWEVIQL